MNDKREFFDGILVTAMPLERAALLTKFESSSMVQLAGLTVAVAKFKQRRLAVLVTGMGQLNACMAVTQVLAQVDCRMVLFVGVAGALNQELGIGDVVISDRVLHSELLSFAEFSAAKNTQLLGENPAFLFAADQRLVVTAQTLKNPVGQVGTMIASDIFPAPDHLPLTYQGQPIQTIDMESAGFALACQQFAKPWMVIRAVSNPVVIPRKKILISIEDLLTAADAAAHAATQIISEYHA